MAARPLAGLALCAGVGGLEFGLHLALGDAYRTVGYVERDSHAAAVLVARMEDQALDPAPVWDNVETFDGRPWCGRVDLVSVGFPCQPFSAAGRGRGVDDERWLWPQIARVVAEVAPAFVFCENVPPLVNRGLDHVLRDLAHLGFAVEWTRLSAAAVGASHRRQRLWILATATASDSRASGGDPASSNTTLTDRAVRRWPTPAARDDQRSPEAHLAMKARMPGGRRRTITSLTVAAKAWPTPKASPSGPDLAKPERARRSGGSRSPSLPTVAATWPTPQARDGKGAFTGHRQGGRDLPGQATASRSGPPAPTTATAGRRSPSPTVLNPAFVEWLMGWPIGWTDCERSATASYRSWQRTHSSALHAALASSTTAT